MRNAPTGASRADGPATTARSTLLDRLSVTERDHGLGAALRADTTPVPNRHRTDPRAPDAEFGRRGGVQRRVSRVIDR